MIRTVAVFVPLAVSIMLGALGPALRRRLPPATGVRLLTAAALVCALANGFVLAVAAFVMVGRVSWIAALGHWSLAVLQANPPLPVDAALLAGLVVLVLVAASLTRAVSMVRNLVGSAVVCHRLGPADAGVVVVDDEVPDAYALPGLSGRVVVSTAMLRALPVGEQRVLLAHEAAHLRLRHHWYVQAVRLAAAANPVLVPVARAVATGVERWADEVAAAEVGDRQLAATAVARAGLARAAAGRSRSGPAVGLGAASGDVVERARALLGGPPLARRGLVGLLIGLMLTVGIASAVIEHTTERQFEQAHAQYAGTR